MENMKDGGPAFPVQALASPGSEVAWGMSIRDWFAGQALMGWAAGRNWRMIDPSRPEVVAVACYDYADAMLRARESGREADDNESWLWSQANACLHRLSDGSHTATIDDWSASGATRAEAIRALRAKVKRGVR